MRSGLRSALLLAWLPYTNADDVGDYIRQGLSLPQSSAPATGSGDVFASSCQSALWAWKQASSDYGISHTSYSLTTAPLYTATGPSVSASSVIILCDGYSRAVGSASYILPTQTASQTFTAPVFAAYTTPMPCSIGPSDCANLYSSYSSQASSLIGVNTTVSAPPCATNGNSTIPFSATSCSYGGVVGVKGSSVRLLYWPVRTADNSSYFCTQTKYSNVGASPTTIPGTPTGSGPNTFVTGTLTITSPTVALSYGGLSRVDGCGTTIDHTIITMKPDELSSVRGGRSLYDLRPFNYGDMNWMCPSPGNSSHFTVQDLEGPNCYQNVPAQAYWDAPQRFDQAMYVNTSQVKQWTIINNYQPYVLPAQSVWSETLQSLWGSTALWFVDGSWDPPIALSEAASVAKPTLPAYLSATPTADSTTSKASGITTTASPMQISDTLPSSTAELQSMATSVSKPSHKDIGYSIPPLNQYPSPTSSNDGTRQGATVPGATTLVLGTKTISVTWTSATGLSESMAIVGSVTLSLGGPAYTIEGHAMTAASTGLMIDVTPSPSLATSSESVVTPGSSILSQQTVSNGIVVLHNDETTISLTPGGAAATISSQVSSAATTGLVTSNMIANGSSSVMEGMSKDIFQSGTSDKTTGDVMTGTTHSGITGATTTGAATEAPLDNSAAARVPVQIGMVLLSNLLAVML